MSVSHQKRKRRLKHSKAVAPKNDRTVNTRDRFAALEKEFDDRFDDEFERKQPKRKQVSKTKHKGGSSHRVYYKKQKLTEVYAEAAKLFAEGVHVEEIGYIVDRSPRTIYYWKRKFGWYREKKKVKQKGKPKSCYRRKSLQDSYDLAEQLYYENKTYDEIGDAVNRSTRTISLWVNKFGWERVETNKYRRKYSHEEVEEVRRLYEEEGWWVKKLSMRLDIPQGRIYWWIKEYDWNQNAKAT